MVDLGCQPLDGAEAVRIRRRVQTIRAVGEVIEQEASVLQDVIRFAMTGPLDEVKTAIACMEVIVAARPTRERRRRVAAADLGKMAPTVRLPVPRQLGVPLTRLPAPTASGTAARVAVPRRRRGRPRKGMPGAATPAPTALPDQSVVDEE